MKKVFIIGIGGTAMGNLAVALKVKGYKVSGSDASLYPPMSTVLEKAGIEVFAPDDREIVESFRQGIYIVGNAVSRGHPQVEWLWDNPEEKHTSFAGFLGEYLLSDTKNLVIAGTHGKSTTTAAAAWYLQKQIPECGYFVGGVARDLPVGFHWPKGRNPFFVLEGDEYDTAFFDKRSKFVHYRPMVLVLNNLEFDHADIFRDLEDVQKSFRQVISLVPSSGTILYNGDDPRLREILPVHWTNCVSFGVEEHNHYRLSIKARADHTECLIEGPADTEFTFKHKLLGNYNSRNLAGALLGVSSLTNSIDTLPGKVIDLVGFRGMERRQDFLQTTGDTLLVEDFAHHPTAIEQTLLALKECYPQHKLMVILEPRSNTLRRAIFQTELVRALSVGDEVIIAPTHREHLLQKNRQLNREELVNQLRILSVVAETFNDFKEIVAHVKHQLDNTQAQRLIVVLSNGSVGGIIPQLHSLAARQRASQSMNS